MPWLGRACAAAGIIAGLTALPLLAGTASAARTARTTSTARVAHLPPLQLTVDSVSPSYATPGTAIVIKGKVRNNTQHTVSGLSMQLLSSTTALSSNTALVQFAAGTGSLPPDVVDTPMPTLGHLGGHSARAFAIRLPASDLKLECFGVYPITVKVSNTTGALTAFDPVPMPFWPSKATSCARATRPSPFAISWVWPLIDSPHQGACPGLLDDSLAADLGPKGRLTNLLSVGRTYSTKAQLTWAIDPALLDNAETMTKPYLVGNSATCRTNTAHPADQNATTWLKDVQHATTGQPAFVTPYADVDIAGLARYGDNADLHTSFSNGDKLAAPLLGRDPTPAPVPAGSRQLSAVAWPSKGLANPAVLQALGAMKIGTVILAMPPSPQLTYTPGAVTSMIDGVGSKLKVLLADNSLTNLLGSRAATSRQAGMAFNVSQLFLAETAMLVAEAPAMQRPIMVTPPRRWNPSHALATNLLADTAGAPWLKPSTIGQLSALPQERAFRNLARSHPKPELPGKLLKRVAKLDKKVTLLKSIMVVKNDRLSHAVYGIESSAWSGGHAKHAQRLLNRTTRFVKNQFAQISVAGRHVIHVTLGGRVGSVTVSIHNSLSYNVKVGLQVKSSNHTVTAKQRRSREVYIIPAHSSAGVKLSVNATQTGKATLKLSLRAPNGVLLPDPPDKPLIMEISATNLGTVALVIFAAALAVFVVLSAAQAIRRGKPGADQPEAPDPVAPDGTGPGGTGPGGTGPGGTGGTDAAGVGLDGAADAAMGGDSDGADAAETTSAEVSPTSGAQGDRVPGPDQPDKFDSNRSDPDRSGTELADTELADTERTDTGRSGPDRSDLSSVGQATTNQRPTQAGHRSSEQVGPAEHRPTDRRQTEESR